MQKVTWFSIPASNPEAIKVYYRDVFGWDIQPKTNTSKPTLDFSTALTAKSNETFRSQEPGVINGCIINRDIGLTHPTILITVENLDQKILEIEKAGGKVVHPKTALPEAGGYFAFVADPEGNVVEIWERIIR